VVLDCGVQPGYFSKLGDCRFRSTTAQNQASHLFLNKTTAWLHAEARGRTFGLADPSRLQSHDGGDKETIQVIIETPKGSRNKFAFDDDQKVFELKKVLPAGMTFPHDFGFIPSTKAEDGDPVDVLVLMDEPAYPGCLIKCRPVGIIEGEQGKNKKDAERNDRVVAIELMNHTYAHVKHVDDLGKTFIKELEDFFINYHELSGKQYRVLDVRGPGEARRRIKDGMRAVKKK
jgi:inorganic pyrophosphatase